MNSLSSIQGINNKGFTVFVPPIITVANSAFTSPSVSYNGTTFVASRTGTPYTSNNSALPGWNLSITYSNSSQYVDVFTRSNSSQLSTTYPDYLGVDYVGTIGTITISQSITIPNTGTYQLSFYALPSSNYTTALTISASFGSQNMSATSLNPSATSWVQLTLNNSITSTGSYTISITMYNGNSANVPSLYITNVQVTYLHA
jgi:hypothetical protein